MAKQQINIGLATNDGRGDSLRVGAQKINENFTELYAAIGSGNNLNLVTRIIPGEGISVNQNTGQITITNTSPNRNTFKQVDVAGQESIIAQNLIDTLTVAAGSNVTITTVPSSNTLTISVGDTTGNIVLSETGNILDSNGDPAFVSLTALKSLVEESTDFEDFKTRIAAL